MALAEISIFDVLTHFGIRLPEGPGVEQGICCPFHDDERPSARVYPDSNSVYCFRCGKKFDVIEATYLLGQFPTRRAAMAWLEEMADRGEFDAVPEGDAAREREGLFAFYELKMAKELKSRRPKPSFEYIQKIWRAFDDKVEEAEEKDLPIGELREWLRRLFERA